MDSARLEIRLKPRAKADRIDLDESGRVDIAVTSPPVDDRANAHMAELLADWLKIPKRAISIIKGGHSRNKVVGVEGLTREKIISRIAIR
jgi:uncharacterized protein (TIGR00251 family)